jgi:formimidoylglutamate deiminase
VSTLYRPDFVYVDGEFREDAGMLVDDAGYISAIDTNASIANASKIILLPGKAVLPGCVNAHSHSFQRLIRGKAESRAVSGSDFWSWRGRMYHAAAALSPEDIYDVARMAFLEMAIAGTTTVGEFHYLHTDMNGRPYDDPNLLAKQIIAAAQSIGIRIVLLRSAYLRSGFRVATDAGQSRFFESCNSFIENIDGLMRGSSERASTVTFGIAPHSIRAVPLADLHTIVGWARERHLPIHMHVAEQVAENRASLEEYGMTPVALLAREGILGADFTAVHSIHMDRTEMQSLAQSGAMICSCPTTERNLGDGIIAVDSAMALGISFALGSDSQAQIAPLEDARQLEYHLRLAKQQRSVLDAIGGKSIAARLFETATTHGSNALGIHTGELRPGLPADFFCVDLNDPSIAGNSNDDLFSTIVFSLERTGICDVVVQGKFVIRDRRHSNQDEVIARYKELHRRVWRGAGQAVQP